jgi:hypothetical protein
MNRQMLYTWLEARGVGLADVKDQLQSLHY